MSAPVINLTASVLGYQQWQSWAYQPWASGLSANSSNIAWTSSALPPGLALNASTGLLSGAVTKAGVYNVGLQVTDSTSGYGTSATVMITIGIEATAYSAYSGADVFIDVATGKATASLDSSETAPGVLFFAKEGEDRLLYVRFHKSGTILDLGTLASMNFALKEFDPDTTVILSSSFAKQGTGTDAIYILDANFVGESLAASLENYAADTGTFYTGLAEISWAEPNTTGVGNNPLQRRSRTFNITVERNLAP